MEYTKTIWKDLPDTSTPITADRLNNLENGVEYLFENGTASLKKLWENEDVGTAFSEQTITLSSDDYDYLVWIYNFGTGASNQLQNSQIVLKGANVFMGISRDFNNHIANFYRCVNYVDDTSFTIGDCSIRYMDRESSIYNIYIIPVAVYGGKF